MLSKLKSTDRLLKSISSILTNMEICYEIKSYIVNTIRRDFNINEEHINNLKKEEEYIIKRLNEIAISDPKSIKSSIIKIRKNDLIYFKVKGVLDKYYKIATLNMEKEDDDNNDELKEEIVKDIEESEKKGNINYNKKSSRLTSVFKSFFENKKRVDKDE